MESKTIHWFVLQLSKKVDICRVYSGAKMVDIDQVYTRVKKRTDIDTFCRTVKSRRKPGLLWSQKVDRAALSASQNDRVLSCCILIFSSSNNRNSNV